MARFCSSCGAPQTEGTRFCGSCGQSLANLPSSQGAATPPSPPPAADSGERVLGVVPNLSAGTLGAKSYVLVVTDRRLLVVRITSQNMAEVVRKSQEEGKAQGKGFFERWGDQISAFYRYAERYLSMAPGAILAENGENYAIDHSQVTRITIDGQEGQDDPNTKGTLRLDAQGKRLTFQIPTGRGITQAKAEACWSKSGSQCLVIEMVSMMFLKRRL
ncbi:MAG: zinc ribbon domain-containing protein [Coprothermobacterota bacterium]|nr:zinc ribbon domain-containing protein [Coprothermobacterota bacterium]